MCDGRQSETNSTAVLDQVEKRRKTWPMRKEVFSTRERWLYLNSIGYDPSVRSKLHQEDRFQLNKTFPFIIQFVPRLVTVFRYWQNYFRPRNSGWITLTCLLPSIVGLVCVTSVVSCTIEGTITREVNSSYARNFCLLLVENPYLLLVKNLEENISCDLQILWVMKREFIRFMNVGIT